LVAILFAVPTVSVVLPTYNRGDLLRQAIASVVGQTFEDWELVVADDGSADETRAYLEGLRDPRIRAIFLEHTGSPGRARAAALRTTRAPWIAFLDSDDIWVPHKLATQLGSLATHAECCWSYTGYRMIDMRGSPIPVRAPAPSGPRSGWILEQLLTFEVSVSITTILARRSLLDDVGGVDESIGLRDDYDLSLRLAMSAEVCAVSDALTLVREHADRTTSARPRAELFRDNHAVFRKMALKAPTKAIRRLCNHQSATQLAEMARALSHEGQDLAALAAIGRALRGAPLAGRVWRVGAGCLLRGLRLKRPSTFVQHSS
jgi:glycosyltransferase involved in cell wall biosynthesis